MREHGGDRREGRERGNDKRKQSAPASYLLHLSAAVKGPRGSSHNEECHLRGRQEGSGARLLLPSSPPFSHYFTESCRPPRGKAVGSDGESGRRRRAGEGVGAFEDADEGGGGGAKKESAKFLVEGNCGRTLSQINFGMTSCSAKSRLGFRFLRLSKLCSRAKCTDVTVQL